MKATHKTKSEEVQVDLFTGKPLKGVQSFPYTDHPTFNLGQPVVATEYGLVAIYEGDYLITRKSGERSMVSAAGLKSGFVKLKSDTVPTQ